MPLLTGSQQSEIHVRGAPGHVWRIAVGSFTGQVNEARIDGLWSRVSTSGQPQQRSGEEHKGHCGGDEGLHSMSPRPVFTMRPSSRMVLNSLSSTPLTKAPDFSVL